MPETLITPSVQTHAEQVQADDFFDGSAAEAAKQAEIQAQRDQWAENNPGSNHRTSEWLNLGLEDIARLETEADAYGFDAFDRKSVGDSFAEIQKVGAERETRLRQKYEAEGYSGDAYEKLIKDKSAKSVEEARLELVESSLPYPPDAKGRDKKKLDKRREQLLSMLSKTPGDFENMQTEWTIYEDVVHTHEIDRLHGEGLKDDKNLRVTSERARLKQEMAELDSQNGEVLDYMSQFGIEKDVKTADLLKVYKEKTANHAADEDLLDADRLKASMDFKWRLGEILAEQSEAQGHKLSDDEISRETQEAEPYIETWLESMAGSNRDPLANLTTYKQKETAYKNWDKRRHEAVEFLAPVILGRTVKSIFERKPEKPVDPSMNGHKALKIVLDPRSIGEKNGGKALRHSEELSETDAKVFGAGIMGQLELARTYSRHQGNVMKAALMLNGLAVGVYEELSLAWDKLSEEEKKKEFKKKLLGKAAAGRIISKRVLAKAAQKAKAARSSTVQAAAKVPNQTGYFSHEVLKREE